jgi:hypothetical protein
MIPIDQHVHLEKGPYSLEWLGSFIQSAANRHVTHLGIVEHTTQFRALMMGANRQEFAAGDDPVSLAQKAWFERQRMVCENSDFKRRGFSAESETKNRPLFSPLLL